MSTKNSISKTESSQELLNIRKLIIFKDLFREYYPDLYKENSLSFNPFQPDDKNPDFKLYDDPIPHGCDFGNDKKTYDIFDLHELRFGCSKGEAIRALKARAAGGIVTDPPKKSKTTSADKDKPKSEFKPWKDGNIVAIYDYTDENGQILYQNVKYQPKDPSKWPDISKTFLQGIPDPDRQGWWIYKLGDTKRVPFGLVELLAAPKDQPVFVCEGEKDALAMRELGFVATSVGSAKTGPTNLKKHKVVDYFSDRHVVLVADKDEDGRKYVAKVAPVYATVAASVKIIEMPGDGIKDAANLVERQGKKSREIIEGIVNSTKEYVPGIATANKVTELKNDDSTSTEGSKKKKSKDLNKFQKLNICLKNLGWKLFFDQTGEPWASVKVDNHYENIQVTSRKFRRLIRTEFMAQFDDGIGFDTIEQVVDALLGEIEYSQAPRTLHVRTCWNAAKDKILIDSGNPNWDVIEIGPDGWQIIQTDENPFKRARKTAAYSCTPDTPEATWDNLFEFIRTDSQKTIIKMWLCLALFPNTARPGLVITGPAGSAKTTTAGRLKQLVDPSTNDKPNRFHKNEDDMIAPLANYAVSVLDNANQMTPEQSDLLCQTITGLDDERRALFTNGDIHNIEFMCTWIITGVNNPGKKSDFLRRIFLLQTELIPENEKISEDKIRELSQTYAAGVQTLIFNCMSQALKNAKSVKVDKLQGLTQANTYSLAMAEALGLSQEQIAEVWATNQEEQQAEVSSGEILTELIPEFLGMVGSKWEGTPGDHLEAMYSELDIEKRSYKKSFPKSAVHLTRRINTIIENLSGRGILIINGKKGGERFRQIYNTATFQTNPFDEKQTPDPSKVVPINRDSVTQPSLSQQETVSAAVSCNRCSYYQGNDYCAYIDGIADPENCPLENDNSNYNSETNPAVY